jgi:hypothetical protein
MWGDNIQMDHKEIGCLMARFFQDGKEIRILWETGELLQADRIPAL